MARLLEWDTRRGLDTAAFANAVLRIRTSGEVDAG